MCSALLQHCGREQNQTGDTCGSENDFICMCDSTPVKWWMSVTWINKTRRVTSSSVALDKRILRALMVWLLQIMKDCHCNGYMAQLSKDIVKSHEVNAALFHYRCGRSAEWFLRYDKNSYCVRCDDGRTLTTL